MANEEDTKSVMLTEPVEDSIDPSPVQQKEAQLKGKGEGSVGDGGDMASLSDKLGSSSIEEETKSEKRYHPPREDPYKKAVKYMEMHNIMQIFQHLTSEIVYHRPVDPLDYMLEELQRMKDAKIKELNS